MFRKAMKKTRGKMAVAGIVTASVVTGHYTGISPDAYIEPDQMSEIINFEDENTFDFIEFVDGDASGISDIYNENKEVDTDQYKYAKVGTASYYADKFHGKMTANGEIYNMYDYTAAHKTLPFGTIVKVTNQRTGKKVLLKINDRGPYVGDRIIDLSVTGAKEIGALGLSTVKIETFHKKKIKKKDKDQLIGYSLEKDFVLADTDDIKMMESTTSFGHAFRLYQDYLEENPDKDIYIFNDIDIKGHSEKDIYHIGVLDKARSDYAQMQ
ncbi:MAG: hypothetical protein Kapaf2KO_16030 [Candidatus Kapaibacteriales bacterium]